MATRFQLKRSAVGGVSPTALDLATAELAVNLADKKLFTSNGTSIFEIGSNLTSLSVGNTTTVQTLNSTGIYSTGVVNTVSLTIGTSTIANATGVYTTGTVNGAILQTGGGLGSITSGVYSNSTIIFVGNSTVNATINSTSFSGTANNASSLGGTAAASYQLNSTLNANIASYLPTYTGVVNGSSHTTGSTGTGSGGLIANVTTLFIGNNTVNAVLNTTGLNINTASIVNTSGVYTTGVVNGATVSVGTSFTANTTRLVLDTTVGLQANGGIGTAGQVLTSNATTVYWSTPTTGTVTSISTGNGLSGGPITSTGTVSVLANSGITANSTGTFVTQGTGMVVNATGVHVNATYIGTLSANNTTYLNGQLAAYYTNASNITTGTLPWARAPTGTVNTSAAFTFSGLHTFNGNTSALSAVFVNAGETSTISATAATGTINYDVTTQSVLYYTTNASANWTVNFRGSSGTSLNTALATNQSITVAFLVTQGATAYYASAHQIDGSSVTPKWQGGTAPTAGNPSSIDVYVYTIIKTASATFTVLASQTKYA